MSDLPNDITPEGAFPPEEPPKTPSRKRSSKRKAPVFTYLIILFLAAFILLAMSYFMQQRKLEGMDESLAGLKESVSAMQGIQSLQEENGQLRAQVEDLQQQIEALNQEREELEASRDTYKEGWEQSAYQSIALNWLREIQSLYEKQYYRYARPLIQEFEAYGLKKYLPTAPIVSAEEPDLTIESASDTYQRIVNALYPDGVPTLEGYPQLSLGLAILDEP